MEYPKQVKKQIDKKNKKPKTIKKNRTDKKSKKPKPIKNLTDKKTPDCPALPCESVGK